MLNLKSPVLEAENNMIEHSLYDYWALPKLAIFAAKNDPENPREITIDDFISMYRASGHDAVGFADYLENNSLGPEMAVNPDGIEEYVRWIRRAEKRANANGKPIKINAGLTIDTSIETSSRFSLPYEKMNKLLDYVIFDNVHSKKAAMHAAAAVGNCRQEILALQYFIREEMAKGLEMAQDEKVRSAAEMIANYAQFLERPCFNIDDVLEARRQMPDVAVGIFSKMPEHDFNGYYPEYEKLADSISAGLNFVLGKNMKTKGVDPRLLNGVNPYEFVRLLKENSIFLVMPFSHNGNLPRDLEDPANAYISGIGGFKGQIVEKGVKFVPGSKFLALGNGQNQTSGLLKGRIALYRRQGYNVDRL